MTIALTVQNQWYDVVGPNTYTTTISGATAVWRNVIQARWTSRSGSTYYVEYRAIVRKSSGTLTGNTSSHNGFAIWGTGAPTVSVSADTLRFPNIGDNLIQSYHQSNPSADVYGITYGSINVATAQTPFRFGGGTLLASGNSRWGGEDLVMDFTLPSVEPNKPTIYATPNSKTSVAVNYGTANFNDSTGSISLYANTTSGFTPDASNLIDTKNTTGNTIFTHTGLTTGTTYYYKAVATNSLNSSTSDEVSATVDYDYPPKIYGSVNGDTTKVDRMYGSVNGDTARILKVYGSVNGQTKRIF